VTAAANVIFSQNIRNKAKAYITHLVQDIGVDVNVRVGFAPDAGELLYPVAYVALSVPLSALSQALIS
jgi:hypothetical protein